MLKRFEVTGFKNFAKQYVLDFSNVRDYKFNTDTCIRDGLLNKIIVYGKNAVGKSNLGLAIFDVTSHLTDKNIGKDLYDFYLNADSKTTFAEFRYVFQFGDDEIEYHYRKTDVDALLYEEVVLNGISLFIFDYKQRLGDFTEISKILPTLKFDFKDPKISILRYIVSNSISEQITVLEKLIDFVSNMLWFRNLDQQRYVGYKENAKDYYSFIFEGGNLVEFNKLLNSMGVSDHIVDVVEPTGEKVLYFLKNKQFLPFHKVASSGTKSLYSLFYWLKTGENISFLCIDEFDSYYHFELAETIVKMLESSYSFQTMLTSHNTNLLSNSIMRPDCYFILTKDSLTSFADSTSRELREGHNLEKLYMSGEFGD